jgi:hypothetical protein
LLWENPRLFWSGSLNNGATTHVLIIHDVVFCYSCCMVMNMVIFEQSWIVMECFMTRIVEEQFYHQLISKYITFFPSMQPRLWGSSSNRVGIIEVFIDINCIFIPINCNVLCNLYRLKLLKCSWNFLLFSFPSQTMIIEILIHQNEI